MPPVKYVHSHGGPDADESGAESFAVDAALDAWRRKAAQVVLTVVAVAHLPVIILGVLGHGPPMNPLARGIGLVVYLVLVAAAFAWRLHYRIRLSASFLALYPALAIVNVGFPHGPYAQVGVVTMPIFALVLLGAPAARITILASTAIIVSGPFLRAQPAIVRMLVIDPAQMADPPGLVWFQATVKAACLFGLMVLLDRFHRLLMDALTARIAAQQKAKREMHERQRLEREIASVGDEERRRLGQELHDGVCQQVTAALLRCQAMERRVQRGGALSGADFTPLSSLLADTIDDAHNVASGLCPLEPEPDALAPALRALTRRTQDATGVRCEFVAEGDVRVPDAEAAQHLYRIGQEALSNAARHAKASKIAVQLRASDGELSLQVEDDGSGLPAELPSGGMGLRTMAYRAEILNGKLIIEPAFGAGTRIVCRVPRPAGALASGYCA